MTHQRVLWGLIYGFSLSFVRHNLLNLTRAIQTNYNLSINSRKCAFKCARHFKFSGVLIGCLPRGSTNSSRPARASSNSLALFFCRLSIGKLTCAIGDHKFWPWRVYCSAFNYKGCRDAFNCKVKYILFQFYLFNARN